MKILVYADHTDTDPNPVKVGDQFTLHADQLQVYRIEWPSVWAIMVGTVGLFPVKVQTDWLGAHWHDAPEPVNDMEEIDAQLALLRGLIDKKMGHERPWPPGLGLFNGDPKSTEIVTGLLLEAHARSDPDGPEPVRLVNHDPVTGPAHWAGGKQHPDDAAVDRFAAAMKHKLAISRGKGRGGWEDEAQCSIDSLACMLVEHVAKGDPVDIANLAMMLHQREAAAMEHHPCNGGDVARALRRVGAALATRPEDFGQRVTKIIADIRAAKTLAMRDSLFEKLIELIEPSPELK